MGEGFFNMKEEFAGLDFNSKRLEERFIRTMETLSKQPDKSIWFCSENRAEAKAIYRMLGNEDLSYKEILQSHRESTIKRIISEGKTILAVQDTTTLNYNKHNKTAGIGYVSDKTLGLNIHSCLAVTTDGLVLGLLSQMSYNRPQAKDDSRSKDSKKSRNFEDKESYRWSATMKESTAFLPETVKVITVCDREGDIYELFGAAESSNRLFLIRIAQNRMSVDDCLIMDSIREKECMGRMQITIPRDSRRNLKERNVILELRFGCYEIKRPKILDKNKDLSSSLSVYVIYAKEESLEEGTDCIEWFLITNESIESVEAAYERVYYYTHRWKIERFHYVLKSGCCVEKLQERSIDKTSLLVLMYSIISVCIMNLTYISRLNPAACCDIFFDEVEWKVLYCSANKTRESPARPYTIAEAVKYLSWLGGPRMSPSDGLPGLKTIWTGLEKLNILLTYREWLL